MACLLLLCGLPASGKTRVAEALRNALEAGDHKVVTIRDGDDPLASAGQAQPHGLKTRAQLYKDSGAEKQTRANLNAATDRALATRCTVLVDSLNYIKGFRYELYCLARKHNARYALVHVTGVDNETCVARDGARRDGGAGDADGDEETLHDEGYGEQPTRALIARFEPPNASRKWERPLHEARGDLGTEELAAFATDLATSLQSGTSLAIHKAVAATAAPAPDGLAALDRVTRAAEAALVSAVQGGAGVGSSVQIPSAGAVVRLGRRPRVAEIRAMRRAYVNLSRVHVSAAGDDGKLADEFVAYVNAQVQAPR